jgi:transcriptional regulator with XRE-family HTH domain
VKHVKRNKMGFKENLKRFRNEKGLSQHELAKLADVTHTNLVKLEAGFKTNPTMKTLIKLSKALDISIDKLVGKSI